MFKEAVKRRQALQQVSDKELLEELRARGRLVAVDVSCVAPGHAVELGYPIEDQWRELGNQLGFELVKRHHQNQKPFMNVDIRRGNFVDFLSGGMDDRKDRRVDVQMYYLRAK